MNEEICRSSNKDNKCTTDILFWRHEAVVVVVLCNAENVLIEAHNNVRKTPLKQIY